MHLEDVTAPDQERHGAFRNIKPHPAPRPEDASVSTESPLRGNSAPPNRRASAVGSFC
jgi:hypothetical protein